MIPSPEVLASHGLFNFELDVPPTVSPYLPSSGHVGHASTSAHTTHSRVSGWANLRVAPKYPTLTPVNNDERVRVYWTPLSDPASMITFRRQAQIMALDTVPFAESSTSSSISMSTEKRRRYGLDGDIIAWWEDMFGLWLIKREDPTGTTDLVQWWARIFEKDEDDSGSVSTLIPVANGRSAHPPNPLNSGLQRYAEACDVLLKVVHCLIALQIKGLALLACRPHSFAVNNEEPSRVVAIRLTDIAPLPGFSWNALLGDNTLAQSPLFNNDPLDASFNQLTDHFIRRNLRYLSPGVVGGRRLSLVSSIYSFGVLAYELVTGSTIDGGVQSPDETDVDLLADIHRHLTTEITPPITHLQREAAFGGHHAPIPPVQLNDIIMKCLARDLDERYGSLDALAWDLNQLARICRVNGDLAKFKIGEIDAMSRFHLPPRPVYREDEFAVLEDALAAVAGHSADDNVHRSRVINVWGLSGSGKSRLVSYWSSELEGSDQGQRCLLGQAKLDDHLEKPLSSFIQIFQCLLDRVLTDPKESPKEWVTKIKETLGSQFSVFHSLMNTDIRRLLTLDSHAPSIESIDWTKFLPAFKLWSKRLLQIFATRFRPLVLVVDDIQWMPQEEVDIWHSILDGQQPLNYALVISLYRVDNSEPPPAAKLLSVSSTNHFMRRLPEAGVAALTKACFNADVEKLSTLASFLYAETKGSPLFLRTLLVTLVKERVIYFDFGYLIWRFDPLALQSHLADSDVDDYLERVQSTLPQNTREFLTMLSCLPSTGFDIEHLSQLLEMPRSKLDVVINLAAGIGAVVTFGNNMVKFAHDRQRATAYRLIPRDQLGKTHLRLSNFLQREDLQNDFIFDAADHAWAAHNLGALADHDQQLVALLLRAASKAAFSASFVAAKRHLNAADNIIDRTGGMKVWIHRYTNIAFQFAKHHSEVCTVLQLHDESLKMLEEITPMCETVADRIRIGTLQVRQLSAANRVPEAMSLMWRVLDDHGFNIKAPTSVELWEPDTVEDVELMAETLKDEPVDEDDPCLLVLILLAFAGPTIFVSEVERRKDAFRLSLSLVKKIAKVHPAAAYGVATFALVCTDVDIKESVWTLVRNMCYKRPTAFLTSSTWVVLGAMAHVGPSSESGLQQEWLPLVEVSEVMRLAFETTVATGNYELAAYVVCLDSAVRRFSKRMYDPSLMFGRQSILRPYISTPYRVLVNAPVEYAVKLLQIPDNDRPWILEGAWLTRNDIEQVSSLSMHVGLYRTLSLRLAIFFDGPLEEINSIVAAGNATAESLDGTVYGLEWAFLTGLVALRTGDDKRLEDCRVHLSKHHKSPDYRLRVTILDELLNMRQQGMSSLGSIDRLIDQLDDGEYHQLSGLVNYSVATMIQEHTKSSKLAVGYLRAASNAYRTAECAGLCFMLRKRYGALVPSPPPGMNILPETMDVPPAPPQPVAPPPMRRASVSQSGDTTISVETYQSRVDSSVTDENLDTLTLMRSSLALASEQDPPILLCTLLRILCQFARADFAAIGLSDENDKTSLRLRAAGQFGRIMPYDLSIHDDASQAICPTVIMMHVARTGNYINKPNGLPRMRADPFFNGKTPRTLVCVPINNQGKQAGVILLSSMTTASSQVQSSSAREVISCLATFATIVTSNYSFTKRLKQEVDQRTKELSNALQAKTQFLSQCSHELRSPLSAVLGLAAVLEASPGLSAVQREHLRTIISSGEDLLGLINNILDHSRLESHSVTLERLPFSLRDVVEGALDTIAAIAQKKDVEVFLLSPYKSDPPGLMGDSFRIKQVLLNLLSNAVKFTPKGRVTVRWNWEEAPDDRIQVTLMVEDTGIGIPAQKMDKLFRSFSQIDESITRSFGGSGLGLIISKDLAKLLGGDCSAESEYGKGSRFSFSFVAEKSSEQPPKYQTFDEARSAFIICPSKPWWGMLEENLASLNVRPVRFQADAKEAIVNGYPEGMDTGRQFDYVIVDIMMIDPEMLAQMQKLQPKSQFIFLVRSIDLAKVMNEFDIARESIVARPIKFESLYDAMVIHDSKTSSSESSRPPLKKKKKREVNRELSRNCPLDILIVDDNPVNITVGKRILEMFGYNDIPSAMDGQQAIDAAEKAQYDLILLDLQMPVMDGFRAHERIKASPLAGDPCVVALTANADKETEKQCRAAGFFDYLSKPLDIPRLEAILSDVFEHRDKNRSQNDSVSDSTEKENE